ncbi:hypothetical protein ExPUPEC61_02195 [Escherichia coli]|nr:hypothetical protein ExPUPEC61_02195 [Escherichia coli]
MIVFGWCGCYCTNGVLQLANSNSVMGFRTIRDVDDLTIFTIITDRQRAKQFAIRGVITDLDPIFRNAGITGAFHNQTAGDGFATQRNTRLNDAVAAMTDCHAAIAFGNSVIPHSGRANTCCAGIVER